MKTDGDAQDWTVFYSNVRREVFAEWTRQGRLASEQEALAVARLLMSQGMIVSAIHEGSVERLNEAELAVLLAQAVPEGLDTDPPQVPSA